MAASESSDIFMKMVLNGAKIAGASTAELVIPGKARNPLLKDFEPGYFFELERFSFRTGTVDDDAKVGKEVPKTKGQDPKKAASASQIAKRGGYQSWRSGQSRKYPVDLQPITFNRVVDSASTTLIQACIDCQSFDSATIIKRKAAGSAAAGEVFLRVDCVGVLVIEVNWDDDDQSKEDVRFITRSVTMSYRPQLPDGSLGGTVTGFWSMVPNDSAVSLR